MKGYIEERAIEIARYIIDNNTTVRQAAKHFGISKSTVHKDVTERLEKINASLAAETRKVLDVNKSERHIRGAGDERKVLTYARRCASEYFLKKCINMAEINKHLHFCYARV